MTTTDHQLRRPVRPGTATVAQRSPGHPPGSAGLPRTSTERPWDRVRFAGPSASSGAAEMSVVTAAHRTGIAGPPPADHPELPEPGPWAAALVRSAVEALLGVRPATQLARWLTGDLYEALARRAGLAVRVQGRPRVPRRATVRSVHVCSVRAGVEEATVVVHDGQKVRAAAVRLEVHRGRWRATALEIG